MNLEPTAAQSVYLAHAADNRTAAGAEALDNVRIKYLASAAAWEGLADLSAKTAILRAARLDEPHA